MIFPASWTRRFMIAMVALTLSGATAVTQKSGTPQLPNGSAAPDPFGDATGNKPTTDPSPFGNSQEKQARLRNDERQQRLVADSERLLSLATALNDDVKKTDKHILSVDVVRRADEIEKLAHSVKERMKG